MNISELFAQATALSLRDAAVQLARARIPVFPCWPGAKNPLVKRGLQEATPNVDRVTSWWRRWPEANIGIPTGPASAVDVVDVDVKGEHPRGYESFDRATRAGLLDGWHAHVVTPSGGLHIYYPADVNRPQRSWQAAGPQVDFRGDGGYIIAPPSRITLGDDAVPYRLLEVSSEPTHSVDAQQLRDFLDPQTVPRLWPQGRPVESVGERAERLAEWIGSRAEGERNRGLFWASCRLAEAGASPAEVRSSLGLAAERIGLSPREIETTIRSAYRAVHTAPRMPPIVSEPESEMVPAGRQVLA